MIDYIDFDTVGFLKKYFNAGNAEWFPFDDDVVDAAWHGFLETRSNADAITAIRVILDAGLSLPTDLNPFVLDALDAWSETRGTKQEVSARKTQDLWEGLVGDVHYLRMKGETRNAALQSVAEKNHKDIETLRRHYSSNKQEGMKEAAYVYLGKKLYEIAREDDLEKYAAFVAEYPNFIKEFKDRKKL